MAGLRQTHIDIVSATDGDLVLVEQNLVAGADAADDHQTRSPLRLLERLSISRDGAGSLFAVHVRHFKGRSMDVPTLRASSAVASASRPRARIERA